MTLKPQARKRSTTGDAQQRFTIRMQRASGAVREYANICISSERYEGRRRWTIYQNPERPEDLCTLDSVDVDLNSSDGFHATAYWLDGVRAERVTLYVELLPRVAAAPRSTRGRRSA